MLSILHNNTNMSPIICKPLFLCIQQIYMLLVFCWKCYRKHLNTQCLPWPRNFWKLLPESKKGVWILWALGIHLHRDDVMMKAAHCLKITGSFNWKQNWRHILPKLEVQLVPTTLSPYWPSHQWGQWITMRKDTAPQKEMSPGHLSVQVSLKAQCQSNGLKEWD